LAPQLLVGVKSPVAMIPVMSRASVPVLVIVTVCGALFELTLVFGNTRLVGPTVADGLRVTPVPVTVNVCGLPVALSVIVNWSVTVPVDAGLKATLTVHVPPEGATVPTQSFESVKSLVGGAIRVI